MANNKRAGTFDFGILSARGFYFVSCSRPRGNENNYVTADRNQWPVYHDRRARSAGRPVGRSVRRRRRRHRRRRLGVRCAVEGERKKKRDPVERAESDAKPARTRSHHLGYRVAAVTVAADDHAV